MSVSDYWEKALELEERLSNLNQAILSGLGLAFFKPSTLDEIDQKYYSQTRFYFDQEYIEIGLNDWEEEWGNTLKGNERIAVIGAGTGREVFSLEQKGFDVVGYECHPEMVSFGNQYAQSKGLNSKIVHTPRHESEYLDSEFDIVWIGWGSYSLMPYASRRVRFLRNIIQRLKAKKVFISFFILSDYGLRLKTIQWISYLGKILGNPSRELGDDLNPNFHHTFTEGTFKDEMSEAGIHIEALLTKPYGHAWGTVVS